MPYIGERRTDTSPKLARIVVGDTVLAAHTNEGILASANPTQEANAWVQKCLDELKGPQGDTLTQAMLAQYALSESAAAGLGIQASLDLRVVSGPGPQFAALTPGDLKEAMIKQLQAYLDLPQEKKADFLKKLKRKAKSKPQK